ncbi:unnamed protein product [Adineta ricciae]|uniref:ER membrane protein complex subunit 6 n=1 Tax=Adineta ricciae TaxID=249248 RepID=A0A813W968_ADIRI|nr:unnamed protein product [Adineta ricciae]
MSTSSEMQIRRSATTLRSTNPTRSAPTLSSATSHRRVEPVLYSEMAVRLNENSLEQCRTSVSALSGCVAGILGLTSYKGFLFYGFSMFFLSSLIYWYIRHEHRTFFTSLNNVFFNGFFNDNLNTKEIDRIYMVTLGTDVIIALIVVAVVVVIIVVVIVVCCLCRKCEQCARWTRRKADAREDARHEQQLEERRRVHDQVRTEREAAREQIRVKYNLNGGQTNLAVVS